MDQRSRQRRLVEHVNRVGIASVRDLSREFGVSEITIRRDIDYLAKSRLLQKIKGGAQRLGAAPAYHEERFFLRLKTNVAAKEQLAKKAAELIEPGDTVFLCGSTTTVCLARLLAQLDPKITILTNSLYVALELAEAEHIRMITVGGLFDSETFTSCSVDGETSLPRYQVKKAFLSCTGFVVGEGTYENSVSNVPMKRMLARSTARIHLVVDSSKFGRHALHRVLEMEDIDVVITESGAPADDIASLKELGREVYLVDPRLGESDE